MGLQKSVYLARINGEKITKRVNEEPNGSFGQTTD